MIRGDKIDDWSYYRGICTKKTRLDACSLFVYAWNIYKHARSTDYNDRVGLDETLF